MLRLAIFSILGIIILSFVIPDDKDYFKYVNEEGKMRCKCFKKVIHDEKQLEKEADRMNKKEMQKPGGVPVIWVNSGDPVDSCLKLNRSADLKNFVESLDSLGRKKFEKNVLKYLRSNCNKQYSEIKKLGFITH